jgi:hypothetical protein
MRIDDLSKIAYAITPFPRRVNPQNYLEATKEIQKSVYQLYDKINAQILTLPKD